MLFHFYFITSQPTIRSLPAAHHGEVCDLSKSFLICPSSVGNYRSLCFVYKFFRNVYFFFMGSDPNVGIQIVSLINTKNRLGDYTMPWLHWGSSPDICSNWDIWTPTLSLQNRYRSSIFLLRRRTFLFLQRMWFLLCPFFMGSDPRVATGYLWNCLSEACIYPQRY